MTHNFALVAAVLVGVVMAGGVSARDVPGREVAAEVKEAAPSKKGKGDAVRKAKQAQTGGDSAATGGTKQDVPGKVASESRKQHDTVRKTIDNLK